MKNRFERFTAAENLSPELIVLRETEAIRRITEGLNIPAWHLKGISLGQERSKYKAIRKIGKHLYEKEVRDSPGILQAFREAVADGEAEDFINGYTEYLLDPGELKQKSPELYAFFATRIFYWPEE